MCFHGMLSSWPGMAQNSEICRVYLHKHYSKCLRPTCQHLIPSSNFMCTHWRELCCFYVIRYKNQLMASAPMSVGQNNTFCLILHTEYMFRWCIGRKQFQAIWRYQYLIHLFVFIWNLRCYLVTLCPQIAFFYLLLAHCTYIHTYLY